MPIVIYYTMDILWDESKNRKLRESRGVSFEDVAQIILDKKYLTILENAARPEQLVFILSFQGYTHVVPFTIDVNNNIILKTIYPSRKFHRIYGKGNHESET